MRQNSEYPYTSFIHHVKDTPVCILTPADHHTNIPDTISIFYESNIDIDKTNEDCYEVVSNSSQPNIEINEDCYEVVSNSSQPNIGIDKTNEECELVGSSRSST